VKSAKKKILALLMALALFTFAACSKGNITKEEAEKKLSAYLIDNYGFVEGSDYLEGGHENRVLDIDCFVFDWRYGPLKEGIQDRLAGFYAVSTDGSKFFYYDIGEDSWFMYGG
jgi:hypothetical protein